MALAPLEGLDNSLEKSEELKEILIQETERKGFVRMGIAYLEGNAYTSDYQSFSVSDRAYFSLAKQGESSVSARLVD